MAKRIAAAALAAVLSLPVVALANVPLGACCLQDGRCQDLPEFSCTARDGSFIGFDTSCARVNCQQAPALSLGGILLVAGLLMTFGFARVLARRRKSSPASPS